MTYDVFFSPKNHESVTLNGPLDSGRDRCQRVHALGPNKLPKLTGWILAMPRAASICRGWVSELASPRCFFKAWLLCQVLEGQNIVGIQV